VHGHLVETWGDSIVETDLEYFIGAVPDAEDDINDIRSNLEKLRNYVYNQ